MELCVSCTLVGEQMELCVSCTLVGEQMELCVSCTLVGEQMELCVSCTLVGEQMELCVSCTLVGAQMELCVSCTLIGEQMELIIQLRGVIPICQHLSRKIETMFLKWVIKKRRICTCFDPAVGVQQLETAAPFPDQLLSCRTTPCRPLARFQRN